MCVSEWARELGISRHALELRLAAWPIEKALTAPKGKTGPRKPAKISTQAVLQAHWRTQR